MHPLDTIIFIGYMAGVTLFGASFYRKNRTPGAFTLGNRNIPGWVLTLSIFATFVSSISYLALPGTAYQSNWNPFVFSLTIPLAAWIAIRFFVPLYRKLKSPSAYTYLEQRFGRWARIYASICYLLTQLMRVGTILYLLALTLHAVFGWNMVLIIVITGITIMAYSMLGGLQAVVWTDAIQGILLIIGAVLTVCFILSNMPEGPAQVFRIGADQGKFSLGSFSLDVSTSTFWVVLVYGIFINLQNFGIDQSYIQRYMASRTDRAAKRSALSGGLLYIPVSLLFLFIGTSLYTFYTSGAAVLPTALQNPDNADQVFPYFIVNQLPTGVTGILIASIFAAGMSTISTSFNSSATVFLTDYYGKSGKREVNEKASMRVLYLSSVVISILGGHDQCKIRSGYLVEAGFHFQWWNAWTVPARCIFPPEPVPCCPGRCSTGDRSDRLDEPLIPGRGSLQVWKHIPLLPDHRIWHPGYFSYRLPDCPVCRET